MRSLVVLVIAAACGKHEAPTAKKIDEPAPAPPAPRPIAACDQLADALAHADQLDTDSEVIELLRDQAALLRAATRAPRDADRAELTVRCTHGLMALAKVPRDSDPAYGIGAVAGGVVGGLGYTAPAPPPPPPPPHSTANAVPSCRHLFAILDRMASCADLPADFRDTIRQARGTMVDAWGNAPQDQDTRDLMDQACRDAANGYAPILTQYHCP